MEIKLGVRVYSSDNRPAGDASRVVIDPRSNEMTHFVIQKGFLFSNDRLVPVSSIYMSDDKRIIVEQASPDLMTLPQFADEQRVLAESSAPGGAVMNGVYSGAPVAVGGGPRYIIETTLNIPEGTVALKKDAKVIAGDGHSVGHVERVITAAGEYRVTHLVIAKGLLMRAHKLIPVEFVANLTEEEVDLTVNSPYLDSINIVDYQPEMHLGEPG
jgi:uncharacterized protein YrrD